MPCRLRSSNEEIFALGDAAAELSITLQDIRQDSTGDESVPVPLDSVSLQRVTTLFQKTRWNIPHRVVKAMLGRQDDAFDHAVTLLRDLHWFNAPLLETVLAESVAMLLSGQSARALRLLLRAPKPTWFGDEAMQAALTEPLLTAPQLIGTDGTEEAEEETASSHGMTAGTIMLFLERCDARTLRELKAVSAAWQRWAREVLGGANSVWRQLVQQADADEARLEDTDPDVRLEAMHTLGKLDPTLLEQYADAIITRFDDDHGPVREAALKTLGKLDPTLLEHYADAIITRFDDDHGPVREAALETLGKLEPALLSEHAAAIVEMFDDDYEPEIDDLSDDWWFQPRAPVRSTAVRVLGRLTQGVLATHTATVIAMLDDYWDVRTAALETLGKLEPALLAQHEWEVAEKLCDVHEHVREAAFETLRKLGPAVVAKRTVEMLEGHEGTIGIIVSTLDLDDGDDVLETACEVLGSLDPTVIAPYAPEIIRFVSKFDEDLRDERVLEAALETLAKLDPAVLAQCAIDMIDCEYDYDGNYDGVAAIQLLGTLDPMVLEQHAAAIVARLDGLQYFPGNDYWKDWRQIEVMGCTVLLREQGESKLLSDRLLEILGKLEPAVLAQHATTVISMLDVDNDDVSDAACEFLGMLDPTVLEQHATAIAARLGDDWRAQLIDDDGV